MPTRDEMLRVVRERLGSMPENVRADLLRRARESAAAKKLARDTGVDVVSAREGKYDPRHPELFRKDPERLLSNLKAGAREAADFIARLHPAHPENIPRALFMKAISSGEPSDQYGGMLAGGSAPGDSPASGTSQSITPVPNMPSDGSIEAIDGKSGFEQVAELLMGTAPVEAVRAAITTPGGPFKNPGLALDRAHGALAHSIESAPLSTAFEAALLPTVGRGLFSGVRGAVKGSRSIIEILRDVHMGRQVAKLDRLALEATKAAEEEALKKATGEAAKLHKQRIAELVTAIDRVASKKAVVESFETAQRAATERIFDTMRSVGESVITRKRLYDDLKPFAEEMARRVNDEAGRVGKAANALTRDDLRRVAEQIALESESRRMFPFSPIPRPQQPQTVRDLFRALPERAFINVPPAKHVTADDILNEILPAISSFEPKVNAPMITMQTRIGGKYVDGVRGPGWVMEPGEMVSASYNPKKVKILPSGKKDLARAGRFPRVAKKGRVEFRPQVANTPPKAAVGPPITKTGAVVDDALPVASQVVASADGQAVFRSNWAKDFFTSVESRVKSPGGRAIVASFKRAFEDHHVFAGSLLSRFGKISSRFSDDVKELAAREALGIKTGSPEAVGLLRRTQALMKEVETKINKLAEDGTPIMVRMADGEWAPWRGLKDFFPRKLDNAWRDAIWADTKKVFDEARVEIGASLNNKKIAAALEKAHEKVAGKLSEQSQRAIDHMIASHWAQSPGEAWAFIARRSFDDMYRMFGHIDKHRVPYFPLEAYSTNFDEIATEYMYGAARRIAEARQFGGNGEILRSAIKGLPDSKEAAFITKVAEQQFGDAARAFASEHPELKSLYDAYTEYSVATKIGLGTATIPNLTQFMISTLPVLGVRNTLVGAMRLVFDPNYVKDLKSYGVMLQEVMQTFVQEEFHGKAGRLTNVVMKPFVEANKLQKLLAAAGMDAAYDDLARAALNGDRNSMRLLARLGVSPKNALSPEVRKRAIFRFAAESQLQREAVLEPIIYGNPAMRPFILFKRFGFRQAKFINDWILKDAFAHGNVGPLLRLAASGWLGGEMVGEAKDALRDWLRGQPSYNPPKPLLMRIAKAFAEVGSFGIFTDVMRLDGIIPEKWMGEIIQNGVFAATPLPVSDFTRAVEVVGGGVSDIAKRGIVSGGRRAGVRALQRGLGTIPGNLSHRLKSRGQVENEVLSRARDRQRDVNTLIVKGDWQGARDAALDWNKKFAASGDRFMVKMPADADALMRLWVNDEIRKRDLTPEQREAILKVLSGSE